MSVDVINHPLSEILGAPQSDRQIGARTPEAMLDLAVKLKVEQPKRTAAQVVAIMGASQDCPVPSRRTVQRHFARLGLNTRPDGTPPEAFGRFEAAARNDRWTGDALHGPQVGGAKTYLFAFIDDHSRLLVGYRWGRAEDTVRLEAAFRHGLSSRGVPRSVYVDYADSSPSSKTCNYADLTTNNHPGQPHQQSPRQPQPTKSSDNCGVDISQLIRISG